MKRNLTTLSIRLRIESLESALNIIRKNTTANDASEIPVAETWQDVDELIAAVKSKIRADIFTTWDHAGETFTNPSKFQQRLNFEMLSRHLDVTGFKFIAGDNPTETPEFVADEMGDYNFDGAERVGVWTIFQVTEILAMLKPELDKMFCDCIDDINAQILLGKEEIGVGLYPHRIIRKFKGFPINEFGLISFLTGQAFIEQQRKVDRYFDSQEIQVLKAIAKNKNLKKH